MNIDRIIIILLTFNTLLILVGLHAVWDAIDKVKRDTEILLESKEKE